MTVWKGNRSYNEYTAKLWECVFILGHNYTRIPTTNPITNKCKGFLLSKTVYPLGFIWHQWFWHKGRNLDGGVDTSILLRKTWRYHWLKIWHRKWPASEDWLSKTCRCNPKGESLIRQEVQELNNDNNNKNLCISFYTTPTKTGNLSNRCPWRCFAALGLAPPPQGGRGRRSSSTFLSVAGLALSLPSTHTPSSLSLSPASPWSWFLHPPFTPPPSHSTITLPSLPLPLSCYRAAHWTSQKVQL